MQMGAAREDFDVTCFVRGLDREKLQHFAKVRMRLARETREHEQRGRLVLDQIGQDLDERIFDFIGMLPRARSCWVT